MLSEAENASDQRASGPVRPGALSALLQELAGAGEAGANAAWARALRPGAVIGRFELLREVGHGGFGVVWEARDRELGRTVAFKALRPGRSDRMREEQLLREAETAAQLSHPNIVTLYDVGRTEHGPYLVLELLHGETLAQRLEQGPLSVVEALRIATEVAKGLAHAHAHGVVHRDLTPGNVFLCEDGQVKVLDLGMAHAFGRRKVDGGTPAYMAPEQSSGAPEDERTDVFALGVILYQMIAGELPFGGRRARNARAAPRLDVPTVPGVGSFVGKMLDRDPVLRPRDAVEALAALSVFQRELARISPGAETAQRAGRASGRDWRSLMVAAAAVALLATGTAVGWRLLARRVALAGHGTNVSVPFLDLSAQHDQEYFSDVAKVEKPSASEPLVQLDALYPSLDALYQDLHREPELSLHEEKTAAKMAARLRALGFEVAEKVGGTGIVGVLRNGQGPTVLLRTELDALPVKEETGLPYASTLIAKDESSATVPVMHACGHDVHMTSWVGAATLLARSKDRWRGTLVMMGQPAEERLLGARAMIADGLLTRFPRPEFAVAIHVEPLHPAGQVAHRPGFMLANADTVEVVIYGKGGHAAAPHETVDPVVMAARTVVQLQTLVSRELNPTDPAVVTVASIHGGTKSNIVPDEVKLQLTVRSYRDEVQRHLLEGIVRIAKAEAAAAGAPREPTVTVSAESAHAVWNDPALDGRLAAVLSHALGKGSVVEAKPGMGAEDFGELGRAGVPAVQLQVGAAEPGALAKATAEGRMLPRLHSSKFAPDRERTIRTGVTVLTLSALELLGKP